MCEGDYEDYVTSLHAEIDDLTRRYYRAELCFITEVYGRRHAGGGHVQCGYDAG